MTEYKIALVGFGGVNRGLAQLVAERNARWQASLGFSLKIVGVSDIFLGSIVNRDGLDAAQLVALPAKKGAFAKLHGGTASRGHYATSWTVSNSRLFLICRVT